jgi:ribosomal subunit interface protein
MQTDITFRDIDSSEAVEAAVQRWAERLEHVYDRIVSCHITIERPHRHQRQQSEQFHVSLRLEVPGAELASTHHTHHDVYVAIGDAFRTARRQLQDFVNVRRGFVKRHPLRRVIAGAFNRISRSS